MNKITICLICLCVFSSLYSQSEFRLEGNIKFIDETNKEYPGTFYKYLFSPFNVKLFYLEANGKRNYCPGEFQVDNKLKYSAAIREQCCKNDVCLFLDLQSEYGLPENWEVLLESTKFTFRSSQKNYQEKNVYIKIPSTLLSEIKEKIFKHGTEIFKKSPEASVLFFRESFRDNNLDYIAKSANFLEENKKQALVADVLRDVDFNSLQVSEDSKFKLFMRRALASRAGNDLIESLTDLAKAQGIYPNSIQPISIAYTIIRDESDANSSFEVSKASERNPDMTERFAAVYSKWKNAGKPIVQAEMKVLDYDAFHFTSKNIETIKDPK